ncbi:hypothetical protein GHT40_03830 [Citrobacter werkmanii]|jgi:hypothetical protein|uniref:hypothetical protein n=1 Tax=Citrobacter werkmanii TaxID=67827 RepID=UPI001901E4ED|nr:hypothetical protein [Citrobacter werkmanii]MBJ9293420.1 hypothetical protein [Citrobacter werkmanii]
MDRIVVVFFHYMIGVWFSYFFMGTKKSDFFIHFAEVNANQTPVRGNSTAG